MNKILLIAHREFKNRVQKKSFLIATILLPLIFPTLMGILIYVALQQEKNASQEVVHYLDESGLFRPRDRQFTFKAFSGPLEDAKKAFAHDDSFGLLYIPQISIYDPVGIVLYTKVSPSPNDIGALESMLEDQLKENKMHQLRLDAKVLDSLKTDISIKTVTLTETGQEQTSDSNLLFIAGMVAGIMMYLFIFIYGAQIMQGIIEEKTSKVVEIIISSVRPFQLMMGKILGLASVGLLQFLIWIILITTLSTLVFLIFGIEIPQQEMAREMTSQYGSGDPGLAKIMEVWTQIPFSYMIFTFVFYFLGGYLIYGALFAAVGSAVDSPAEAQQFMFPITIPMLIAYFSLFTFILPDPHSSISIWLSLIPFTSPIAMMGRVAFGVPGWQLGLSMFLLIGGFILTTWVAARIYRVGILMHGTKVNYKVLAKWFMMKN
jgi:ABC-2 type transport system permease protein